MIASLSREDVQDIIRLLDASQFDELKLEMDDLKLELRRGPAPVSAAADPITNDPISAPARTAPANAPLAVVPSSDFIDVPSPLLGTFYYAPKPGADPFVKVGDRVDPTSVIGIIEVMKLMNPVMANVTGEVAEIIAPDSKLVEYGQVLIRVRPV